MTHSGKTLIIRISSLGDVILASASLNSAALPEHVDWAVAQEFSQVIDGHPRLHTLYSFDRKSGYRGWVQLCRTFWEQRYDQIYDLHNSLRTRLMRVLFLFWSLSDSFSGKQTQAAPRWKSISKPRLRLWGFFLFKRFWPRQLRPEPWVQKFARSVGGSGSERPDLRHLCVQAVPKKLEFDPPSRWICVMPSSRWSGKTWPVSSYADLISKFDIFPVVLGTAKDSESHELVKELQRRSIAHYSAVGKWDLRMTAWALNQCPEGYLGSDTGLAHLAEAVGAPARMLFGPTHPEMGFGPWGAQSRSIQTPLSCRPCSRNGRFCYRFWQPYACLRDLSADHVRQQFERSQC